MSALPEIRTVLVALRSVRMTRWLRLDFLGPNRIDFGRLDFRLTMGFDPYGRMDGTEPGCSANPFVEGSPNPGFGFGCGVRGSCLTSLEATSFQLERQQCYVPCVPGAEPSGRARSETVGRDEDGFPTRNMRSTCQLPNV